MIKEQSTFLTDLSQGFQPKSEAQKRAMDLLMEVGLPTKRSEAYKYTAIATLLEKKVDRSIEVEPNFDIKQFYKTAGSHLVIRNGIYDQEVSRLQKNIEVSSKAVSEGKHDPLSLLNTALSPAEITIQVTDNTEPIFIYQVTSVGLSNPRIKVTAKDNQEITLVEKLYNFEKTFTNSYIEFDLGRNSNVNYTKVQAYEADTYTHETVFAKQVRDSRFYSNVFSFSGGTIRNNITINLADENCEGHMHGLYLLDGKTHLDNNTSVDHMKPNSYSNELYKGILDEKSTGVFNGKIYVRADAQKTNAFQSNNNILLSDNATVNTKPQLEIWADDVKCSHGCTSGQLDEEAIFYLRARGIAEKNAKAMILNAFALDTLAEVKIPEVQEEIESLIATKLL